MEIWRGRQITAARALAGLTIHELARAAGVTERTIRRIESAETIMIAERVAHGAITRATWEKVLKALIAQGVELIPATSARGAGVCWIVRR